MADIPAPTLDRRVKVVRGDETQRASLLNVSQLRDLSFVVLLGEPGMGKTTVLQAEAVFEGASVLKVRALVTGGAAELGAPLFLDGLDEYRSDGSSQDKLYALAKALTKAKPSKWRLACRTEDWLNDRDTQIIADTLLGQSILVAQLLPLDIDEVATVLRTLGETDPEAFIAKAQSLGATAFLESPLSLKLLREAVGRDGAWPTHRFDLFQAAIDNLLFEYNDVHKYEQRASTHALQDAASTANFLLLTSGAPAIWRGHGPPATGGDRPPLSPDDLAVDGALFKDMLDTPLFLGEGDAFEPMHRTLAEFLGGAALARAVQGGAGRPAFPLDRAVSFIVGADGAPPSDLRGLYGWFATHLAKLGLEEAALQLIEADAVTVLIYGDAAIFSTTARIAILENLDRRDPYFRRSETGITTVGGLAGEDLASRFINILTEPGGDSHLILTVLDVLTQGGPVESVRPTLRALCLDPSRLQWLRWRAADAWMNGVADKDAVRGELLAELASETPSMARETLRAHLMAALAPGLISDQALIDFLNDYERHPNDNVVMRLYALRRTLESHPRPSLFDTALVTPHEEDARSDEVQDVLDHLLAAAISKTSSLTAVRLWGWLRRLQHEIVPDLGDAPRAAFDSWFAESPLRELELYDAIFAARGPEDGAHLPGHVFTVLTGRPPASEVIEHLIESARAAEDGDERTARLRSAIALARQSDPTDPFVLALHRALEQVDDASLLESLTAPAVDPWREHREARAAVVSSREDAERAKRVADLTPLRADLRQGRYPSTLDWAAGLYLRSLNQSHRGPRGLDQLIAKSDQETASAIAEGWRTLAHQGVPDVDAALLGAAVGGSRNYYFERPALVGLDRLLEVGALPAPGEVPLQLALVVLARGDALGSDARQRVLRWAAERLDLSVDEGAEALFAFWTASVEAGATYLRGLGSLLSGFEARAAKQALHRVLSEGRIRRPEALRDALNAAIESVPIDELLGFAACALQDEDLDPAVGDVWSVFGFLQDPRGQAERFVAQHGHAGIAEVLERELDHGLICDRARGPEQGSVDRNEALIRYLGPGANAEDSPAEGRIMREARLGDTVRARVEALSRDPSPAAGAAFVALLSTSGLDQWRPLLRHAQARQAQIQRDQNFTHARPAALLKALQGGPPVNAEDLRAIVLQEIRTLKGELHLGSNTPWKRYWNTGPNGAVVDPKVENQCRDALLDRLQDRMKPYGVAAALAEARAREETRADMLVLSGAGGKLPIEAKRNFHPDVWTAAATQLQGYSAAERADGFGVYLVFWFGNDLTPTPARPDGGEGPTTAEAMETALRADLPCEMRERTTVIVFDVSNPQPAKVGKPRKKRGAKPATNGDA